MGYTINPLSGQFDNTGEPPKLANLDDFDLSAPADGDSIAYNQATGNWEPYSNTISQEVDTTTTAPTSGKVLKFKGNSNKWESDSSSLNELTDVNLLQFAGALEDGAVLVYANGEWVAGPKIGGVNYNAITDPLAAYVPFAMSFEAPAYIGQTIEQTGSEGSITSLVYPSYGYDIGLSQFSSSHDDETHAAAPAPREGGVLESVSFSAARFNRSGTSTTDDWRWFSTGHDFCFEFISYCPDPGYQFFPYTELVSGSFNIITSHVRVENNTIDGASLRIFGSTYPGNGLDMGLTGPGYHHYAVTREGNTYRLFADGNELLEVTDTQTWTTPSTVGIVLGLYYSKFSSPTYSPNGRDTLQVRMTWDHPRYTEAFTPPTYFIQPTVNQPYSLGNFSDLDLTTTPPVNANVLLYDGTSWVPGPEMIDLAVLKAETAAAIDFADFQTRIAAL